MSLKVFDMRSYVNVAEMPNYVKCDYDWTPVPSSGSSYIIRVPTTNSSYKISYYQKLKGNDTNTIGLNVITLQRLCRRRRRHRHEFVISFGLSAFYA